MSFQEFLMCLLAAVAFVVVVVIPVYRKFGRRQ
jgi:hypothetical protein